MLLLVAPVVHPLPPYDHVLVAFAYGGMTTTSRLQ
jgi:hypothetical protein